jgi:hypothetical protein
VQSFQLSRDAQELINAVWTVWGSLYCGLHGWLFTVRASKIETFVEVAAMAATCVWLVLRRFNNHKTKSYRLASYLWEKGALTLQDFCDKKS